MSEAAEIEKKLEQTRLEMTATVDELVDQLDPRKQAKEIAERAKVKAGEASDYAKVTVEQAKEGDTQALAKVAGAAAAALLLGGLIVRRLSRRG